MGVTRPGRLLEAPPPCLAASAETRGKSFPAPAAAPSARRSASGPSSFGNRLIKSLHNWLQWKIFLLLILLSREPPARSFGFISPHQRISLPSLCPPPFNQPAEKPSTMPTEKTSFLCLGLSAPLAHAAPGPGCARAGPALQGWQSLCCLLRDGSGHQSWWAAGRAQEGPSCSSHPNPSSLLTPLVPAPPAPLRRPPCNTSASKSGSRAMSRRMWRKKKTRERQYCLSQLGLRRLGICLTQEKQHLAYCS